MRRFLAAIVLCGATSILAQTPPPSPPMPSLPPGVGPQGFSPNPAMAGPPMPGAGARPMMPPNEPAIPAPTQHIPVPPPRSTSSSLISFLDAKTPYVQAFDFVLMIVAGIFCLRARNAPGLTLLAISCFLSAIIVLGFFLFETMPGRGALPQAGYIVARLLAPFELLLFVIGIIIVARRDISR